MQTWAEHSSDMAATQRLLESASSALAAQPSHSAASEASHLEGKTAAADAAPADSTPDQQMPATAAAADQRPARGTQAVQVQTSPMLDRPAGVPSQSLQA